MKTVELESARKLINRLRTPGLRGTVEQCFAGLFERVSNPQDFIPEAVADAEHDLRLLAGIERELVERHDVV